MFLLCWKDRGSHLKGVSLGRTSQWLPRLKIKMGAGSSVGATAKG